MENRISALENDMVDLKSMMKTLIEEINSQSIAIGELGKQMGKKVYEPAGEESEQMQQQCVVLSELRKRINQLLLPQREEVQKVKIEIGDDSKMEKLQVKYAEKEMDSGSPENSSEQLDRKFPATTTVTPSVTKNHECG
jgi:seryl-tRNA synthetase